MMIKMYFGVQNIFFLQKQMSKDYFTICLGHCIPTYLPT